MQHFFTIQTESFERALILKFLGLSLKVYIIFVIKCNGLPAINVQLYFLAST